MRKKVLWVVVRRGDTRWKPLTSGLYKVNFDGTLFEGLDRVDHWCVELEN